MASADSIVPVSSPSDDREYRVITLENEMRVILVHDATTDKASAAMAVGVGQLNDPDEILGLAHFLEHMLFLGTEAYPDENEYSQFLNTHSGSCNAFTAQEETNYFFDVGAEDFEQALDIFSHFFIDPLFTDSATEREANAVESEYAKNKQNDHWRMFDMLCTTSWKGHPFHRFGIGSKDTLYNNPAKEGVNTRDALLKFHKTYYSANAMRLAVLGTQSLDELEALVRAKFSQVRNDAVPLFPSLLSPSSGDPPAELPFDAPGARKYRVVPVGDRRNVAFEFALKPTRAQYKTGPGSYVANLIGDEGVGSLLSLLKARGLANSLYAGEAASVTDFSVFSVGCELTEAGLAAVDEVASLLFQYIKLVRDSADGVSADRFEELRRIRELNFRFQVKSPPMQATQGLASNLLYADPADALTYGHVAADYDEGAIRTVLDALRPDNVRIFIESKSFEGTTDAIEPWFNVSYSAEDVAEETVTAWAEAEVDPALALPPANPYIAENVELIPEAADSVGHVPSDHESYAPVQLAGTSVETWHKIDRTYGLPHAQMKVLIALPSTQTSARAFASAALLLDMVNDNLAEESYPALLAGLSYNLGLQKDEFAIELCVGGYNDKMAELIRLVSRALMNPAVSDDRFAALKDKRLRSYDNRKMAAAYEQGHEVLYEFVKAPYWPPYKLHAALADVTQADIVEFATEALKGTAAKALVVGNVNADDARAMVNVLETELGISEPTTENEAAGRVVQLARGSSEVVTYQVTNKEETNGAVVAYYQVGPKSVRNQVLGSLTAQVVSEPAFDTLRTKEQLGYIVYTGDLSFRHISGLRILIQSAVADPVAVDARIEEFLANCGLENMTAEAFDVHRSAQRTSIAEKDKTLADETRRLWSEIVSGDLTFDRVAQKLAVLDSLTVKDMAEFLTTNLLSSDSVARLTAYVFAGNAELPESYGPHPAHSRDDATSYMATATLFPLAE